MGKVHASLFSGFGAADLAAAWMNWENAFWCEIEDFPRAVLSYWFPKSKRYDNIKETDFTPWRGKIDVLTGGFPCQPFSCAGQRKGADDDRYLWPEMLRAIREIRPTWVIGENVGGIISMVQPGSEVTVESQASLFEEADKETILDQDSVVGTFCRDLEQEGYSVQPIVIPACAVGAPHRRDRIFFIAHRADARFENVRQPGENGVHGFGTSANSNRTRGLQFWDRGSICNEKQHDQDKKQGWDEQSIGTGGCCENRIITNSECERSGQIHQEIQSEQPDGNSADSVGHERNVADTNSKMPQAWFKAGRWQDTEKTRTGLDNGAERFGGLRYAPYTHIQLFQERHISPIREESRFNSGLSYETRPNWREFPTQSPVCRGNDGLPFDVVRLTVSLSTWCTGAIKGYGNAIVPQVMFEIFKAIEGSEK